MMAAFFEVLQCRFCHENIEKILVRKVRSSCWMSAILFEDAVQQRYLPGYRVCQIHPLLVVQPADKTFVANVSSIATAL